MKHLYQISVLILFLSCSPQNGNNKNDSSKTAVSKQNSETEKDKGDLEIIDETSSYDSPTPRLEQHQKSLKELADSSVFITIHRQIIATLTNNHQAYFNLKSDYEIIYTSSGDLFQNKKQDNCFVVYDKKYLRLAIIVFDASQNKYSELYRDTKVKNALTRQDCDYSTGGSLDYQMAEELIYQRDYLIKDPIKQISDVKCKIVDISKDEDFVLEQGCSSPNFSAKEKIKSLCIPTSSAYNNWECLNYDKNEASFVIVYGQAFAD